MKIDIPFGKEKLKINIPQKNLLDITTPESNSINGNEHDIIINSLNNPINSKNLSEIVKVKKTAA